MEETVAAGYSVGQQLIEETVAAGYSVGPQLDRRDCGGRFGPAAHSTSGRVLAAYSMQLHTVVPMV